MGTLNRGAAIRSCRALLQIFVTDLPHAAVPLCWRQPNWRPAIILCRALKCRSRAVGNHWSILLGGPNLVEAPVEISTLPIQALLGRLWLLSSGWGRLPAHRLCLAGQPPVAAESRSQKVPNCSYSHPADKRGTAYATTRCM